MLPLHPGLQRDIRTGWGFGASGLEIFTSLTCKIPDGESREGNEVSADMEFRVCWAVLH